MCWHSVLQLFCVIPPFSMLILHIHAHSVRIRTCKAQIICHWRAMGLLKDNINSSPLFAWRKQAKNEHSHKPYSGIYPSAESFSGKHWCCTCLAPPLVISMIHVRLQQQTLQAGKLVPCDLFHAMLTGGALSTCITRKSHVHLHEEMFCC